MCEFTVFVKDEKYPKCAMDNLLCHEATGEDFFGHTSFFNGHKVITDSKEVSTQRVGILKAAIVNNPVQLVDTPTQ